MPTKIILAGEGGQGVQTVAKIIAQASQKSDRFVSYLPSFGVEQRGGVSLSYLQISSRPIAYPRFSRADIVVAFGNRAIKAIEGFLHESSLFVYDNSAIDEKHLQKIKEKVKHYLAVPAQKTAQEKFTPKVANVLLLGAICAHLKEISYPEFEEALLQAIGKKILEKPELKDLNLRALKTGLEIAQNFDQSQSPLSGVEPPQVRTTFTRPGISWSRFPQYCKGCGLCLLECPQAALKFGKDNGFLGNPLPEVEIDKCLGCKNCQNICPDGAIKVDKE